MLGEVVEGLGMGHEAEDAAGGIADSGDVEQGSVGIIRKAALGRLSGRKNIRKATGLF